MERTYLFAMFVTVALSALVIALAGLDVLKTHRHRADLPADYNRRDWLLVIIAVCFFMQALHYLQQACAWGWGADWVIIVRAVSTTIPMVFVLHVLNGRVNEFINRFIAIILHEERGPAWHSAYKT